MRGIIQVGVLITFLMGCGESRQQHQTARPVSVFHAKDDIPAGVHEADILYFKKPFTDSTRYTRFFKIVHVKDDTLLSRIRQTLLTPYTLHEKPKPCLSEGKIIIHIQGDAYRVLYFSRFNSTCPYLYFIRDGQFVYFKMDSALNARLVKWEGSAVEP